MSWAYSSAGLSGGEVNQVVYAQTVGSADSDGQKEHFSSLQQNRGPLETNVNKN